MVDGDVFVNVSEQAILDGLRKANQILPIKDNVEQQLDHVWDEHERCASELQELNKKLAELKRYKDELDGEVGKTKIEKINLQDRLQVYRAHKKLFGDSSMNFDYELQEINFNVGSCSRIQVSKNPRQPKDSTNDPTNFLNEGKPWCFPFFREILEGKRMGAAKQNNGGKRELESISFYLDFKSPILIRGYEIINTDDLTKAPTHLELWGVDYLKQI